MVEKIAFTKEEIESRVKVPAIVEVELKHLIEERLKQSGLYYRIFSRIKTSESLARKYQVKSYNADKKIQDLVGLRVDVYFEDDLRICRQMMERMFSLVEWSESEQNEVEFKPVKINGVFRLPDYLKQQISDETWEMCIDDTFEIQLKTVFFEGWHEIEHDMKYKGGELWSGKNSFARYFNSILATLELCDKSLVTLFENLGHELYKERNWAGMMKAHYRLKMEERPMYPELEELLEKLFHDRDVFDDGNENIGEEMTFGKLRPLRKVTVFKALVNLSTYKYSKHDACIEAARLAYSWIYDKYGHLDGDLPTEPMTFEKNLLGYRLVIVYEPEHDYWKMNCMHIDMEAPGQVWVTEAECYPEEDGRQMLSVRNSYAVSEERRGYLNRYFSCPKFYSNIADKVGLFDVRYLSTSRKIIREYQIKKIHDLILSRRRTMPVCLVVSYERDNGWLNEDWLENFRVYDFTRMAGRYTHIYTCNMDIGNQLLESLDIPLEEPTVFVFKSAVSVPNGDIVGRRTVYKEEDILNCSFGRQQMKQEGRRYDIVKGGQAFYHKLLQEMRAEMMDA